MKTFTDKDDNRIAAILRTALPGRHFVVGVSSGRMDGVCLGTGGEVLLWAKVPRNGYPLTVERDSYVYTFPTKKHFEAWVILHEAAHEAIDQCPEIVADAWALTVLKDFYPEMVPEFRPL